MKHLVCLALLLRCAPSLSGQSSHDLRFTLPQGASVKDEGSRTYRFSVTYYKLNPRVEVVRRDVTGEYTRGFRPRSRVEESDGDRCGRLAGPFAALQKRDFMEGFRYHNDLAATLKPDFFKGFPPTAVMERNLVWDTGMIEHFGQDYFERLKLNEPYETSANECTCRGWAHSKIIEWCWFG